MAMEGMDVEQITQALGHLGTAVSNLETVIQSTNGVFPQIEQSWQGPDAEQFKNNWHPFATALNNAHTQLSELHTHLQSNLQAQQGASHGY